MDSLDLINLGLVVLCILYIWGDKKMITKEKRTAQDILDEKRKRKMMENDTEIISLVDPKTGKPAGEAIIKRVITK